MKDFITGRELYLMSIPGDWNKSAVKQLNDGVISGLVTDIGLRDYNFLNKLSTELLIEGSLVLVDRQIAEGQVLYVEEIDEVEIAYQVFMDKSIRYLKVWIKGPENTQVSVYPCPLSFKRLKELKEELEKSQYLDTYSIPSSSVLIIDNGYGILVPAQGTLDRLAELSKMLSESVSENALRWFVSSYAADIDELNAVYGSKGPFGTIPSGSSFEHMYDSAYTNDIFKQIDVLVPAFKEMTSNFTVIPGESGISRYLGMTGYVNKVTYIQKICVSVFGELGVDISFENVVLDALKRQIDA